VLDWCAAGSSVTERISSPLSCGRGWTRCKASRTGEGLRSLGSKKTPHPARISHGRCNALRPIRKRRPKAALSPTGKSLGSLIGGCVQPPLQKFFRSLLTQITHISLAIPAHTKGRFAIVTDVGHGMRWTRHVKRRMTLRADSEVVWS